jgi:ribokinase
MQLGFDTIIGTGGIGAGVVYALEGNHDLGRNESRMGTLLDQRDFCKLHIILHYVSVLLRDLKCRVDVVPISAVGNDEHGRQLRRQMGEAGMRQTYVCTSHDARTLFSLCFVFPDGSGGNITERNSACDRVTPTVIRKAAGELRRHQGRCMVLSAPEVPLASRVALLRLARKHRALTAASFASAEMGEVRRLGLVRLVDLLAVNIDEAAMLGCVSRRAGADAIVDACTARARRANPAIRLLVTNGSRGLYAFERGNLEFLPALRVPVRGTAGAGDAALAGLMVGTVLGLPFLGGSGPSCARLARLLSALSVTSADTIHFGVNLRLLRAFAKKHGERAV